MIGYRLIQWTVLMMIKAVAADAEHDPADWKMSNFDNHDAAARLDYMCCDDMDFDQTMMRSSDYGIDLRPYAKRHVVAGPLVSIQSVDGRCYYA